MALTQRLELRQSHALVMTPQLMQAIKLLELSNLDLASYVEGELERNPLLEPAGEGEQDAGADPAAGPAPPAESPQSAQSAQSPWTEDGFGRSDGAREGPPADLADVPPADADAATSRSNEEDVPRYSEWAGVGQGRREGGDYNLE